MYLQTVKNIHDARGLKNDQMLKKYSKESLMKSITKKSNPKLSNDPENEYLSQVSNYICVIS